MVAVYHRKFNETTWSNITDYIGDKGAVKWTASLNNELLDFDLKVIDPLDGSNNQIIIEIGDDIAVCVDSTKYKILGNCAGLVIDDGKVYKGEKSDRKIFEYSLKCRQRDFSNKVFSLNYKDSAGTPLTTILNNIFNSNVFSFLGGYYSSTSSTIPRYSLLSGDINVFSFDFEGTALQAISQLCKSIGYFYKVVYYVEPNNTTTINLIQQVLIFDSNGMIIPGSSSWSEGITDTNRFRGYVVNSEYISEALTPLQPQILYGEKLVRIKNKFDTVKNYIDLIGLIQDDTTLTREEFTQTDLDNFILKNKATDIVYVSRLVRTKITAVNSTTQITIPTDAAQIIRYRQDKLTTNNLGGQMVLQVTKASDNSEYIRVFTIDNTNPVITLTSAITGMSVNDMVELISSYDILEEGLEQTVGYPVDGYVIKHVKNNEVGSVKFPKYEKPRKNDTVVIYYRALTDYRQQSVFNDSLNKYGIMYDSIEIPYPITANQVNLLYNELSKYAEPLQEINFITLRPDIIEPGYSLSVDLEDEAQDTFLVNEVKCKFISKYGQKNKPLIEQEITLASYRESLSDILARFKPSLYNSTAKLAENISERVENFIDFQVSYEDTDTTIATLTETLLVNSDHTGLLQLYLVETDGTWLQNLSSNSYYEQAGDFTWAGDKVTFARTYSGTNEDIVIKNIDDFTGSTEVRLTNTAGSYRSYDPSFNHDDSKILYTSEVSGTRLRTMNLDGTSNSSVAITSGTNTIQGRYSPDGQYLLYSRGGSPSYIERRNVDLTNLVSPMHTTIVANFVSRWSKDSTKISYAYLSSATYGLYKMNADGTGHTQLTSSNLGFSSEWSVDGTQIYYQYNNGTQYSLRRINADGTGNTDLIPVSGSRYIQPASIKEIQRPNITLRTGKYLFASNANSENGLFNGTLVGSATASGGSCTIPNDNTSYLRIPANLINISSELTITAKIKINTLHTSSGQWNTLLTASRYNQADNFVLFYDAFNNRWTYRHSGSTDVNFSDSTVEDGAYHFICFQVKLGVGAYSKVFIDDMSTPISTGGNTLTLLDCNMFLFGQDVDSWTGLTPSLPSGFDTNQSWAGLIEYLNITTTILSTAELNVLKTEAGL